MWRIGNNSEDKLDFPLQTCTTHRLVDPKCLTDIYSHRDPDDGAGLGWLAGRSCWEGRRRKSKSHQYQHQHLSNRWWFPCLVIMCLLLVSHQKIERKYLRVFLSFLPMFLSCKKCAKWRTRTKMNLFKLNSWIRQKSVSGESAEK